MSKKEQHVEAMLDWLRSLRKQIKLLADQQVKVIDRQIKTIEELRDDPDAVV